jgi:hypothetical protein
MARKTRERVANERAKLVPDVRDTSYGGHILLGAAAFAYCAGTSLCVNTSFERMILPIGGTPEVARIVQSAHVRGGVTSVISNAVAGGPFSAPIASQIAACRDGRKVPVSEVEAIGKIRTMCQTRSNCFHPEVFIRLPYRRGRPVLRGRQPLAISPSSY